MSFLSGAHDLINYKQNDFHFSFVRILKGWVSLGEIDYDNTGMTREKHLLDNGKPWYFYSAKKNYKSPVS